MNVDAQIERGLLVSPRSGKRLFWNIENPSLRTEDGAERFPCVSHGQANVPVLLLDPKWAEQYSGSSEQMAREYSPEQQKEDFSTRIRAYLSKDYRNRTSVHWFNALFGSLDYDASLVLSVGGGPKREHANFTNVNIGPFPNVDIVADAHRLPYATGSVDAIHCDAVMEHLSNPHQAVKEMYRVLKPGGRIFSVVPFMQAYHGYPHHYQNLTVTGHKFLYEKHGFRVVDSDVCVGPIYMIVHLSLQFAKAYFPRPLGLPVMAFLYAAGSALKPFDYLLHHRPNAHMFASTTFVVAEK
jgi:SAM-dependent methyltransferase